METIAWTVDWNPEYEAEERIKREILGALKDTRTMAVVKRFAEAAEREANDDNLETEHIVWLDTSLSYAFFVRVWYDIAERKLFILVEENDLGDIGFLLISDLECATYEAEREVLKVEFREPEDLGVPP